MDNADIFSPKTHTLYFASAIKRNVTYRSKVITSLIDKNLADDLIFKNGVTVTEATEIIAGCAVNQIALKHAIEKSYSILLHKRYRI